MKVIEISFVFDIAFALIIIAEKRIRKSERQDESSMISLKNGKTRCEIVK